jgi:hypothetical protein
VSTEPTGWQTPKTTHAPVDPLTPEMFNRIEGNIRAIETGERTLDPAQAPTSNVGTLRQLLDWFANRIRAIMGTTSWYNAPPVTLSGAKSHIDAAAPHSGHETPSGAQTKVDTHAAVQASLSQLGHVKHAVLTTTLDTTWQGSEAPYTKTQTVNGLLATDTPIVDVVMSGDFETDEARIEAWGYVYRITTADNAITLYATEKPAVELPIQLKVVR